MTPREAIWSMIQIDIDAGLTDEHVQRNAEIRYARAIDDNTPGKRWFYAPLDRAPVYRALRINPADRGATYAAAPFRVGRNDDGAWRILAAHPTPAILTDPTPDWLDIETVIAWDPISDTAHILGETTDQLAGALTDEANTVFASPRAFFQAWAMRRAAFYGQFRQACGREWHAMPKERDEAPGALLIGDLGKVRLSPSLLPPHIECAGIDPRELNKAIFRAARLPRVSAAASHIRKAA